MKRALLGGLVLALALLVGQVGTSQAAGQSIKYDTYCDGVNLTYDIFTGIASGVRTGSCLISSGSMAGTVAQIFGQGPGVTLNFGPSDLDGGYSNGLVAVIRADHTFSYYQNSGAGTTVWLSGTWTPGAPARPNGGGGSTSSTSGR